jgi:hypothetical protein
MQFSREIFFNNYRKHFGALNDYQVRGLERLLRLYEQYFGWWDSISQIANSLSQIKHETNESFNPVVEGYYLGNQSNGLQAYFQGAFDRVRNFQKRLRYYPYFGMGDIQLTWFDNYEKHEKLVRLYFPELIKDFEINGVVFDLIKRPEQLLNGSISFAVMTIGMHRGTFRGGRKLDDYQTAKGFDHYNARGIVNGDKNYLVKGTNYTVGEKIKRDALKFESILKASLLSEFQDLSQSIAQESSLVVIEKPNQVEHQVAVSDTAITSEMSDNNEEVESIGSIISDDNISTIQTETKTIPDTEPVGFKAKLMKIVASITGGTFSLAMLKEWLQVPISSETLALLKLILPTLLVLGGLALIVWYVAEKVTNWKLTKLQAEINSDKSRHDIKFEEQ